MGRKLTFLNLLPPRVLVFRSCPDCGGERVRTNSWVGGNAVEAILSLRAINVRLYEKYPAFYFYLGTVFLLQLFRFFVFTFSPFAFQQFTVYRNSPAIVGYVVTLKSSSRA